MACMLCNSRLQHPCRSEAGSQTVVGSPDPAGLTCDVRATCGVHLLFCQDVRMHVHVHVGMRVVVVVVVA